MAKWFLTDFTIDYVYRPEVQGTNRTRNHIYLYYNPVYTIYLYTDEWNPSLSMSLSNPDRILNNMFVPSVTDVDYKITDGVVKFEHTKLPSLEITPAEGILLATDDVIINGKVVGSSALKQTNDEYETLPRYDWAISKTERVNNEDGTATTALVIQGRDKYWRYTGIKYYEDKKARLIP